MKPEKNVIEFSLLKTLHGFGLDAVQKTMKTEKNVNKLSGSPGKRNYLALSTLLHTLYVFRLDAVQKIMKTEKNMKELPDSPGKRNF